jgi:two-component system cell cycle sensor histidine kinase PleC
MKRAGVLSGGTYADPRLLKVQVERAAKAIRGTITASPPWVAFFAVMTSDPVPYLGKLPIANAIALVAIVFSTAAFAWLVLKSFEYRRGAPSDPKESARWLRRLLCVSVILSAAWGCAPWLLWDEINATNHVFIALMCLAVVARFLVNRSNHLPFFLASFLPMAVMLFVRCALTYEPADMVLAALVPLYAMQVYLDSSHISVRWDEEALMRFSYEDMSRELEEARDEALSKRAEAEAANTSKTSFLANMSHELRTPLNAILGFSEIIARECLGPVGSPRYKEYAGDIHNSGSHLLSLINDLLDVAKIEAGRMEVEPQMIETARTLDSALKFVGAKARERRQKLTITVEPEAEILYADERALKQIVINLVSNSIKFTRDGGNIDVVARRNGAGDFELMVEDNGQGIPKDKIDQIFRPFSRVDNRYDSGHSGTGLGLSLVRGLAELHGGRAWMESEEGIGTRVFVLLPMTIASQEWTQRRLSA